MRNFAKQAMCLLLIITLCVGFMPTTAFAGYEDGIECEFCGGYRFDDWVCDDGPHCSDSSDASDCYYENHCATCLGPVENSDRCEFCYSCPDCINDGGPLHCPLCGACEEGGYDICEDCDLCMNCQIEAGSHCIDCGDCLESGSQCPDHPFEMYQENHCESCALRCQGCDDKCFLGEIFIDIYCEEHEECVVCATEDGLHCKECFGCYEDELCSECQLCDECGLESGKHCPECDAHSEDWCETGGEGTHCIECASEYLCEQCDVCISCNGTEFCDECGLCIECCRENAESENCSCGEYCIYSATWEDHFCENCGNCFDEYEQCEYCGMCSDCCESESECSDNMCAENPDYEDHFCSQCSQCFDDVQLCEDCESAGELICVDCCQERTAQETNCEHELCVNSWQWEEHYCEFCQKCFVECGHTPVAHEHKYDDYDVCTVCGASRSGAAYIISQPMAVKCNVTDINDPNRGLNKVKFIVVAGGENVKYQWSYKGSDGIVRMAKDTLSSGYDDCILFSGSTTNELTVWVKPDACYMNYEFACGVYNSNGRAESEFAKLNASHVYGNYQPILGESVTFAYWDTETNSAKIIMYNQSAAHQKNCVGDGCTETLAEEAHKFGAWQQGAAATKANTGYKYHECMDCGYVGYEVLPALKEAHVHDYTFGYAQGDAYHWKQCECAQKDLESREDHDFGEWKVTKPGTMTTNGEEQRTCATCKYVETRATDRQGHTHMFYDWDYITANGYIIEDGEEVLPYMGDYGKTTNSNHYAYCLVEGCNEVKKEVHKFGATKWITYPTEEADGVWYKLCGECNFQYDGTSKAGRYQVVSSHCKVSAQTALPGSTVKVTPYEKYDGQYFSGKIIVGFTTDLGKTYSYDIVVEHHTPDDSDKKDYYYFTYPEVPDGVVWTNVWVDVSPQLKKCPHRISLQNVVEATCGETGYTGDMMCELCTYVETAGSTIPATGEHPDTYLTDEREGTCTRKGYSGNYRCTECEMIVEKGKPTDYKHSSKTTLSPIPATCTSEGRTYEAVCKDCGKLLNKSTVIPKRNHRWDYVAEVPATCTTTGMKTHYQCLVCGQYSEDRENAFISNRRLIIPSLGGHKWAEATCAAPKTCTVCGETTGKKLENHDAYDRYDETNHWYGCECGEITENKTAHTISGWVVDKKATLTSGGSRSKSCSCGYTITEDIPQISSVKLSATAFTYNGKKQTPSVTIYNKAGKKLVKDTDYTLKFSSTSRKKIGRYYATVTFKGNYSGSQKLYFTIGPKNPSSVKTTLYGYDDVKVSWSKVSGASGYRVYYKKSGDSSYTFLKTTTSTSYKKKNLSDGAKYYFKVVAYKTVSGNKCYNAGKTSSIYTLKKVSGVKAAKSSSKVKISWTNIAGESGYQISKSTSKSKTNVVATYKTTKGKSKTISATKGKTYYYKVRAYKTVGDKKIYGPWSSVVKYKRS